MENPSGQREMLSQLRIDRSSGAPVPSPRRRWMLPAVIAGVVVVGAVIAWLVAGGEPAPVVKVVAARSMAAASASGGTSVLDASGYVTARRQATVSSKITGKVSEVLIEEGQRVEEGQVLARLDDTEARAAHRLQAAEFAQSQSQLAEIRALLANAERELERQKRTAAQRLTSASELDAAATQVATLQARLASAQSAVQVAQEAVRVAEVQVQNTIVRAPFSGVVTVKAAQPGEMISPVSAGGGFTRTGIGTIVDMDSLEVEVDVNESFINRVQPGQPVQILLNAYPDWNIPGNVIAIIPAADRAKATVRVRIALGVKDARIVPDMGARVAFLNESTPTEPQAPAAAGVVVPNEAVSGSSGAPVVFVYDEDKAEQRNVRLGQQLGGQRQVLDGVRDGERVVVSPPPGLKDGDRIALAQ